MTYQAITLSVTDHVAWLTLNRPEVHNAFDDRMIAELLDALATVRNSNEVRALVLRSEGKNFSAGADLGWMRSMAAKNYDENIADAAELSRLMQELDELPQPTIALVQGAAFGGAVGLAACCDIALATPASSFCLSEVKIGLIPAVISPYVMRAMGTRQARRYMLTAERFNAEEALRIGLVHDIAEDLKQAHKYTYQNRIDLFVKQDCACIYCKHTFHSSDIKEYALDHPSTALCPFCGIDTVLGKVSGYKFTKDFLDKMYDYFFNTPIQP